jgi:hypothetical protein
MDNGLLDIGYWTSFPFRMHNLNRYFRTLIEFSPRCFY